MNNIGFPRAIWWSPLPRPFSLNNAYGNSKSGGRHRTKEFLAWKNEAKSMIMANGPRPWFIRCHVTLWVDPAHLAPKADIDNLSKPVLDVLKEMNIFPDDSWQVVQDNRQRLARNLPAPMVVEIIGVG